MIDLAPKDFKKAGQDSQRGTCLRQSREGKPRFREAVLGQFCMGPTKISGLCNISTRHLKLALEENDSSCAPSPLLEAAAPGTPVVIAEASASKSGISESNRVPSSS